MHASTALKMEEKKGSERLRFFANGKSVYSLIQINYASCHRSIYVEKSKQHNKDKLK